MVKAAEFEEKEFESSLYIQILDQSQLIWTPGQVFEEYLGIDVCMNVSNLSFWARMGYSKILQGVILNDYNFGYMWRKIGRKKSLPIFRVNLFIQAKRPEALKKRSVAQKEKGLKTPYWRFKKTPHQQRALKALANTLGHKALVVYAAPAFDTSEKLYDCIAKGSLYENTNFANINNLENHDSYVYDSPGTIGYGCSKVERYESKPLIESIELIIKDLDSKEEHNYLAFSESLSILYESIMYVAKLEAELNNQRMIYFLNSYLNFLLGLDMPNDFYNYLSIIKFCELNDLNWYVLG